MVCVSQVVRATSPDELIALVPHVFGFQPESSIVCLSVGGGLSARVDLPEDPASVAQAIEPLTDVLLRENHPREVVLLAFGDEALTAVAMLGELADALRAEPDGPLVRAALWSSGDEWVDLITGERGTVASGARTRMAAEFALAGRVAPAASREALAATMVGDASGVAEHVPAALAAWRALDRPGRENEIRWAERRVKRFLKDRTYPSDADAARLLVAIHDATVQQAATLSMDRRDAMVYSELWQDLTRRSPGEQRDAAATLLAFSAWLEGNGAKSWVALDQVRERGPLAELLAKVLERAIDPAEWDEAVPAVESALQRAVLRQPNPTDPGSRDPAATSRDEQDRGMRR